MNAKGTLYIRLKYFREQKGLSQSEVAEHLHLSRQAISHWEAQRSYPDLDNIILLSKLYEISVDELLGTDTKEQITPKNNRDMYMISEGTQNTLESAPTTEQHTETEILEKTPQTILEMLCLAVILVLTCQFSILGMLVPIVIAIWMKKNGRKYKLIYILCVVCFLISVQNTYVVIEHIFRLGTATAEPI